MSEPSSTQAVSTAQSPLPARRSLGRNIMTVMGGTLASRVLGLLRQALFNRLFDTSITDAFNLAYRIPNLFRELLAEGALTNSIIPVYKSLAPAERKHFTGTLLTILTAINAIVIGLGILLAPWVVGLRVSETSSSASFGSRLAAPLLDLPILNNPSVFNFNPDASGLGFGAALTHLASSHSPHFDTQLAITLTQILWPFLMGISLSALAMALLNAEERFRATAFSPLAFSLVSVVGFLLFPNQAIMLAVVTTLGGFAQFLVQMPSLLRYRLWPSPRFGWHPALGRALGNMIPFAFTTGSRELLTIVLYSMLTGFGAGAVTGFQNADQIFLLFMGLFAISPAMATYPRLAEAAAQQDWPQFRETMMSTARLVLFLCTPASALVFVLAPSVVSGVLEITGQISDDKFNYTLQALPALALAVIPWGLNQFLVRAFYVRERTRDAVIINVIGFVLNTVLYAVLARVSFQAMNYATAITGAIMVFIYVGALVQQVQLPWKKLVGYLIKVGAAALAAAAVAWFITNLIPWGRGALNGWLHLALAGGAGGVVYLALALLLRVPELEIVRRRLLPTK
jgi:putative peptidoglycan lipid II flippase